MKVWVANFAWSEEMLDEFTAIGVYSSEILAHEAVKRWRDAKFSNNTDQSKDQFDVFEITVDADVTFGWMNK